MASAKILQFLRGDKPRVLALTGPSGCGKHHAISEAAQQANVATIHHDLAQGAIEWGRLGSQQLTSTGLMRSVHVISNASEHFLKEFAFVKRAPHAKIILVADDASPSMRASGAPVVRMQAMSSDAMAKKLFLDMDWPAEEALRAARAACGNWHQVRAQQQFEATAGGEQSNPRDVCSAKDERLAEPPCFIANRLLNGTAPEACPLDATTISWVERNLPVHCEDLEEMARRQEMLAISAEGLLTGNPTAEELFTRAAGFRPKRMHYQHGLC